MAKNRSPELQKLLTVKEALWTLGISRTTLWRQLHDHQIDCVRIGSRVLFEPRPAGTRLKSSSTNSFCQHLEIFVATTCIE